MSREIVVGVDIDDVVAGWYYRAHDISVRAGIAPIDVIPTSWSPFEEYGCEAQAWYDALADATLTGELYDCEPIPGALEALQRLEDANIRIEFITARGFLQHGDAIRAQTINWLAKHHLLQHGLTFSREKPADARRLGVTHFIDDNKGQIERMISEAPEIRTYLQDRPWNQDMRYQFRLKDLGEFAEVVTKGAHPWLTKSK